MQNSFERIRPMPSCAKVLLPVHALFALGWGADSHAGKRTVCTITVNSSDEKEMFRQRLPEDQYQFVELVERGRPDWLASACRQGVQCDMLVISGHFDGSTEFYSDQVAASEFLPVAEMERASCSDSCPGLFSQLKEVYLFGCNTLNADALKSASAGSRAQPCPRRALQGGRAAPRAHPRSAPRRKQPRSHAPDLHERARHLRLLFGRAAGARRGDPARPLPAAVVAGRGRQRPRESAGSSATLPPSP